MIRLPWVNMIRFRLKEYKGDSITEFIKPILDCGIAEEKRITEAFKRDRQCLTKITLKEGRKSRRSSKSAETKDS